MIQYCIRDKKSTKEDIEKILGIILYGYKSKWIRRNCNMKSKSHASETVLLVLVFTCGDLAQKPGLGSMLHMIL